MDKAPRTPMRTSFTQVTALLLALLCARQAAAQPAGRSVPVLVYHRFAAQAVDVMTVRTETLRAHLRVFEKT